MKHSIIKNKSYSFAVRIVRFTKNLETERREYVLSKQLLRCGTSVGALVREAEHAESRPDFKHKLSIAQKEINETIYWLELLKDTNYMNVEEYDSFQFDATEILKIITSILKTLKQSDN